MAFVDRLKRAARPLAILGCVSIGTVYIIVGVLALLALAGVLTDAADEERMVRVVMDLPAGAVVIWTIVAGIAGYIVWRTIEAVTDPYDFGSDWKGMTRRTAIALSAFGYGVIAWSAARIALSDEQGSTESGEEAQQLLVGRVLDWPGGEWWIGAAGVALLITAGMQVVLMVRRSYAQEIVLDERSAPARALIHGLAWYGYAARCAILGVLGYFFLTSARTGDPSEVGDTDTAFDFIGGGTVGDTLFFVVAAGTIAYGLFMYACARYYQFEPRAAEDGRREG
jgi:hypothetical protein